jgi:hypothetical protein
MITIGDRSIDIGPSSGAWVASARKRTTGDIR